MCHLHSSDDCANRSVMPLHFHPNAKLISSNLLTMIHRKFETFQVFIIITKQLKPFGFIYIFH
ncbi:hypothetical protein C9426_10795 [Serratia sp. S1B]|nr:hypothetical protein C9426_10795 [Serratia sp. S1B]